VTQVNQIDETQPAGNFEIDMRILVGIAALAGARQLHLRSAGRQAMADELPR
jgi:hypothetical protein